MLDEKDLQAIGQLIDVKLEKQKTEILDETTRRLEKQKTEILDETTRRLETQKTEILNRMETQKAEILDEATRRMKVLLEAEMKPQFGLLRTTSASSGKKCWIPTPLSKPNGSWKSMN